MVKIQLPQAVSGNERNQMADLCKLVKSSGIYALSSLATPFISLTLAPFLTHTLSPADYGILTLLSSIISLVAGISQLGLGSAFFRVYNYDYTEGSDKGNVVATTIVLLFSASLLAVVALFLFASFLAEHLLGRSSLSWLIALSGAVILVQNLAIAGFIWLRAEGRAFFFSCMSIGNMLVMLLANIVLVGKLHWGVGGALASLGVGQLYVILCTLPLIISHIGIRIRIRMNIAKDLLAFGMPLIFGFISTWILQLSDRYLLSLFSSLEETAKYAIAYALGSAISIVVIGPFVLAWPTMMFTIAKRNDAITIYQSVFRYFSLVLLLANFSLSFIGVFLLKALFPVSYHGMAFVIPLVSTSIMFYGTCHIFMIGANIKRKTWVSSVFITAGAIVNILLNLVLVPRYGAVGAALSTFVAYIVVAVCAYKMNQKLYPLPFEVGRFVIGLLIGIVLYVGSSLITYTLGMYAALSVYVGALILYACLLAMLGGLPIRRLLLKWKGYRKRENSLMRNFWPVKNSFVAHTGEAVWGNIYMHVRGTVRTDERIMREATALKDSGFTVTILDIEDDVTRPVEEEIRGIQVKHIIRPDWLKPARFRTLRLIVSVEKLIYTTVKLIQTHAEAYHAHDDNALAPCYIAALWHKTPLIFDAHEFPLKAITHKRRLNLLLTRLFTLMVRRCSGIITVSPPIAQEIEKLYHVSNVSLVRNIAVYQKPLKSNRLRQFLNLGPDVLIALYQGNLDDNRSLDTLVRAGPFLEKNIVIVLMGKAVGSIQACLEALIASEGVSDRVKIIPPVPYPELLEWTASADIGLITFSPGYSTSIRLCLPNKLFEYLMAGLPVLASPLDAVKDILQEYDSGRIVSTLSPTDIGAAINAMLADRAALEHMRFNALKAVQEDLCWEQERYKLIQLYQNIVGTKADIQSELVASRR